MNEGTWTLSPCPRPEVRALVEALGLSETTASVLVRRGYGDPEQARAFLAAGDPGHDPFLLGNVAEACAAIKRAIATGKRICVHGDYDVDGICATALAVRGLRGLGAEVEWHLPSRFEEGYGVSGETLARLAEEGCGLVLTVDCGITARRRRSPRRKALGLEVVVTDHHRPAETLPDCPVVAPRPSDYPFPDLCGTGVVYKLLQALEAPDLDAELDLVALATVGDVVPLVDENRGLVTAGLLRLARTTRPGLRALMKVSGVDPARVDRGPSGFGSRRASTPPGGSGIPERHSISCSPRISPRRRSSPGELERLNRDRQAVEERILREALRQVDEWPAEAAQRRAYVHRGRRLAPRSDRDRRVAACRTLPPPGDPARPGRGRVGRLGPVDSGLRLARRPGACAEHLGRWGGHRAAAGLSLEAEALEPFTRAFAAHAEEVLAEEQLRPTLKIDALGRRSRPDARPDRGAATAGAVRAREPRRHAPRRGL